MRGRAAWRPLGPAAVAFTFVRGAGSGVRRMSIAGATAARRGVHGAVSRKITTGATCVEMTTASARAVTLTRLVALASRAPRSRLGIEQTADAHPQGRRRRRRGRRAGGELGPTAPPDSTPQPR